MSRKTYTIQGQTFTMRTFNGRDIAKVTGKLAVLPITGGGELPAWRSNEIADQLLAICSRVPKLTLDEPDTIPDGTLPISELSDSVYVELVSSLSRDSGFSAEAVEEIRPTPATVEPS